MSYKSGVAAVSRWLSLVVLTHVILVVLWFRTYGDVVVMQQYMGQPLSPSAGVSSVANYVLGKQGAGYTS